MISKVLHNRFNLKLDCFTSIIFLIYLAEGFLTGCNIFVSNKSGIFRLST